MAEGFHIADGYMEVEARIDKNLADKAGDDAGTVMGDRMRRSVEDRLKDEQGRFISSKIQDVIEEDGKTGGERFGTGFRGVWERFKSLFESDGKDGESRFTKGFNSLLGDNLRESLMRGTTFGLSGLGSASSGLMTNPYVAGFAAALGAAIGIIGAPFIAANLVAGLGLAAGGGVLAAGIALIANDPRVGKAATDLKNQLLDMDTTDLEKKVADAQAKLNDARKRGNAQAIADAKQELADAQVELNKATTFNENNFSLRDAAKPLVGPLVDALNIFGKFMSQDIGPQLQKSFEILAPYLPMLAEGIGKMLTQIMPGFNMFLEQVSAPMFKTLIENMPYLGEAMGRFFEILSKDGPAASIALADLIKWIAGFIVEIAYILDWTARAYVGVRHFLVSIPGWVMDAVHAVEGAWNSVVNFLLKFGTEIASWPGRIGNVFADIGERIWNAMLRAGTAIAAVPGQIRDALFQVPGLLKHALVDAFDAVTTGIGFALGAILREILALPGQILALRGMLWSNFVQVFSDIKDAIIGYITLTIDTTLSFWSAFPGRAAAVLSGLWDAISGAFWAVVHGVESAGSAVWHTFVNWLYSLPGAASGAASDTKNSILWWFRDAGSWLYNAGRDIIAGIGHGIESMADWVLGIVHRAADNIISGFAKALGIHSPSTVAREKVGKPIAQGIGQGVTENAPAVRTAISSAVPDMLPHPSQVRDVKPAGSLVATLPIQIHIGDQVLEQTVTAVLKRRPDVVASVNQVGTRVRNATYTGRTA